jgi:hypothetical protein
MISVTVPRSECNPVDQLRDDVREALAREPAAQVYARVVLVREIERARSRRAQGAERETCRSLIAACTAVLAEAR